jgi:hypothetical protein
MADEARVAFEDIAPSRRESHQLAVLDAGPAKSADRMDLMAGKLGREVHWQILVKQYAHRPAASRERNRAP